jgi:hypothetical protein
MGFEKKNIFNFDMILTRTQTKDRRLVAPLFLWPLPRPPDKINNWFIRGPIFCSQEQIKWRIRDKKLEMIKMTLLLKPYFFMQEFFHPKKEHPS